MTTNPFDFDDTRPATPPRARRGRFPWLWILLGGAAFLVLGCGICGGVVTIILMRSPNVVQPGDPGKHDVSLNARWQNRGRSVPLVEYDYDIRDGAEPRGPGDLWLVVEHHGKQAVRKIAEYKPGWHGSGGMELDDLAGAREDLKPASIWIEFRLSSSQPAEVVSRVVSAPDLGVFTPSTKK